MDQERWARLLEIFNQVVDLPPDARDDAITERCGTDAELRTLVAQMLHEDAREETPLDAGVAQAAHDVLDDATARDRFGHYIVIRRLSSGDMGVVYLAERPDFDRRVAIKVLGDAWVSPARRQRFTIEQQALARLDHPSIARFHEANTLPDGTPYFVMEYVEGEHLTAYCAAHDIGLAERVRLFCHCCEAVWHAHQHLIIHRDLKPSNIMVTPDGQVKLLDFGIAKQLESVDVPAEQTQAFRRYTPEYASPEQVRGEPVGFFTDVYSLGVILYELLTERLPFDRPVSQATDGEMPREAPAASLAARSTGRGGAASRSQWSDLDVICAKAIHGDGTRRYASADALLRDCQHYLRGEPIEARPDSTIYRTRMFVRRHVAALSAAAAALLLLAGLVTFYTVRLASARNEALAEAAIRERVQTFMLRLFDAGETSAAPASDLRVVSLVDRGVQEARTLDRDPRVQAELYLTLGQVYQRLGNMTQANALIQQSLDQRRALAATPSEIMESLVALGMLRLAQGQPEEAKRLVDEGLQTGRRALPSSDPKVARATMALGKVYDALDARETAIPLLQEAVRLFDRPGPPSLDLSAALRSLANSQYQAGHLDESERLNQRVLAIDRGLRGPTHPSVADDLSNLAAIQNDRGDYVGSEKFRREAMASFRAWYGADHPETASAAMLLSQTLSMQNRLDEATPLLEQALAIDRHAYPAVHPRTALVLNELAIIQSRRKNYDAAEEYFRQAIDMFEKVYPAGHSRTAVAQSNLATVYLLRKQFDRAERGFVDALREMAKVYPDDHLNVGIARLKLGRALIGLHRYREAETALTAGYAVIKQKTSPSVIWLQIGREDLATVYDALGQPDKAKVFRDEYAAVAHTKK
jgi:serine/threonine protein kinase/Tfp pilus assembly protein PilF